MEARLYTGKEPDAGRAGGSASVAVGHQRAWPMVERRRIAHERRLSEVRVRPHGAGFVAGNTATLLVCFMNRRMPNGTSGGVGGRREQSRLLPDSVSALNIQVLHIQRILFDKLPPRLDILAHQRRKDLLRRGNVLKLHL